MRKLNRRLIIMVTGMFLIGKMKGDATFTKEDFHILEKLGRDLSVKNYAFIQSQKNLKIKETLRDLSKNNFFSVVIDLENLEKILDNRTSALDYFERKTMIIIKESLNYITLLQKVSGLHLLYWIVFTNSFEALKNAYIPLNVNLLVVQFKTDTVVVKKVYSLKPGKSLTWKNLLVMPKHQAQDNLVPFLENIENVNFENITLNSLYYLSDDFCDNKGMKLALERVECFHHEIIQITANKLNFTTNIMECPDRIYPYNYPNGTLSTLFLILERREADISGGSFIITSSRLARFDFVWPTFTTRSRMYIKFKSRRNYWKAYVRPFSNHVWLTIFLWILSVGLLIQLFDAFRSDHFHFPLHFIFETIKSILLSLQIFCNQGVHDMPKWASNRLLYIMSFILVLTVYQTYSGHLISSLMFITPRIPFTDLEGYFKDRTYRMMTLRIGYHNYIFRLVLQEHEAEDLMLDDLPLHSKHGITKLCTEENIAFIDFRENVVQHELPCKITEIPHPLLYQSMGLALPKHSPYREFIQRELVILYSTGILQRMRRHSYSYVKLRQKYKSEEEYVPVSLHHIASTFVLLWIGSLVSMFILFLELIWCELCKQYRQYKNLHLSKVRRNRCRPKMLYLERK